MRRGGSTGASAGGAGRVASPPDSGGTTADGSAPAGSAAGGSAFA